MAGRDRLLQRPSTRRPGGAVANLWGPHDAGRASSSVKKSCVKPWSLIEVHEVHTRAICKLSDNFYSVCKEASNQAHKQAHKQTKNSQILSEQPKDVFKKVSWSAPLLTRSQRAIVVLSKTCAAQCWMRSNKFAVFSIGSCYGFEPEWTCCRRSNAQQDMQISKFTDTRQLTKTNIHALAHALQLVGFFHLLNRHADTKAATQGFTTQSVTDLLALSSEMTA